MTLTAAVTTDSVIYTTKHFGNAKIEFLRTFLVLENGIPSSLSDFPPECFKTLLYCQHRRKLPNFRPYGARSLGD